MPIISKSQIRQYMQARPEKRIEDDWRELKFSEVAEQQIRLGGEDIDIIRYSMKLLVIERKNTNLINDLPVKFFKNYLYGEIISHLLDIKYRTEYGSRKEVIDLVDNLIKRLED